MIEVENDAGVFSSKEKRYFMSVKDATRTQVISKYVTIIFNKYQHSLYTTKTNICFRAMDKNLTV